MKKGMLLLLALPNLELLMKCISKFTLECRRMTKFEKNSCCKICQENLRREREREDMNKTPLCLTKLSSCEYQTDLSLVALRLRAATSSELIPNK